MTIQVKGGLRYPGPVGVSPGGVGGRIPGPLGFGSILVAQSAVTAFLLGIPVYLAQRAHMTDPPPLPEYRP